MTKNIVYPDTIHIAGLFLMVKCTKTFNCIASKTTAKLITIMHQQCAETLLFIHNKLALIMTPSGTIIQFKVLIVSRYLHIRLSLVIKYTKTMKAVILPTTGVTQSTIRIIKHTVPIKLLILIHLTLIKSTSTKCILTIFLSDQFMLRHLRVN
jgi:hypothetical protein